MRYMNMKYVKPDMIIGKNVYDANNHLLLRSGTKLMANVIERLKQSDFEGLYIETEATRGIEIEDLISEDLKNKTIDDFKKLNITSTIENAKEIVSKIFTKKDITLDYMDIRSKDNALYQHSLAVAETSIVIGMAMGLNNAILVELATAALFHDLGKLCVNRDIMKKIDIKESKENIQYQNEMHTVYGYSLLSNNYDISARVRVGVLHHHINEDGTGYPRLQTMPENVHLFAKIIHVADEYDIKRHGEHLENPSEALEYLMGGCGTLFNKEVVETLIKYIPVYPRGIMVVLSNGLTGVVIGQNKGQPLRPIIRLGIGNTEINLSNSLYNVTIVGIDQGEDNLFEKKM